MVMLPEGYCIDSTEVTRDQYAAWLATNPQTNQQPSHCSWNTTFVPDASCMSKSYVCQGGSCGNHPQVCVEWCDAFAYCKGVGKRLCGKRGGGATEFGGWANASVSQWYNACASDGWNSIYPYGSTYLGSTCNGGDAGKGTTVPVGSMSGCQSSVAGYQGVYDLSGNVYEWEDSCDGTTGQQDQCRLRGGSFAYVGGVLRCDGGDYDLRSVARGSVGLRCCAP
jgi:formylglycine-generating enzyme required for sulfatase activity